MNVGLLQATATHIPLGDETVQCVVCSPPYWGLRSYTGEQRQAWGGDAGHEHEWGAQLGIRTSTPQQSRNGPQGVVGPRDMHPSASRTAFSASLGQHCPCGAWYGALGLEPTPEAYVEHIVAVFREVRRVLRRDGTVWLNLGDSYASSPPGNKTLGVSASSTLHGVDSQRYRETLAESVQTKRSTIAPGLKPKDLVGIPWRVAFALQADGWWLRSDIVWAKPNPMPESVTDRPTRSHEYVFLLSKSGDATFWTHRDLAGTRTRPNPDYRWVHRETREELMEAPAEWLADREAKRPSVWARVNLWAGHDYFYDADAIREPHATPNGMGWASNVSTQDSMKTAGDFTRPVNRKGMGLLSMAPNPAGRNARSVWTIATQAWSGAHFATFPEALAERCILAGSSPKACGECGAPWARVVEPSEEYAQQLGRGQIYRYAKDGPSGPGIMTGTTSNRSVTPDYRTLGWRPTCGHDDGSGRSLILDPFSGSGTVVRVAIRHGRSAVGLDVSREYLSEQASARTDKIQMEIGL